MTERDYELLDLCVEHGCILVAAGEVGDERYARLLRECEDMQDRGLATAHYLARGFRVALTDAGRRRRAGQP
ncbi:hypothetical protein [Nannocystis punicea]|uniref:Uncharacterized protein n=1 Tax=Nannocystis punicea TaxID=2995304 RepID=A0ABY7HGM6_9BACT|nr:hypothetical protein [Nannocystis poenicansa]WAS98356.1 hypothetical protein O0S08_19620 [Nannocystis poenicansa]